jgi:hypothetical protein
MLLPRSDNHPLLPMPKKLEKGSRINAPMYVVDGQLKLTQNGAL